MTIMNKLSIEECKSIANRLIVSPPPENLGLSGGMMGQCLFYYWIHRKTQIKQYEKTADKLLDNTVENIHSIQSFRFENGLTGIGWSIAHLLRHEFVSGEANEILEEVDFQTRIAISQTDFNLNYFSDFGLYFIYRYLNEERSEFTSVQKKLKHDLLTLLLRFDVLVKRTPPEVLSMYAQELNSFFAADHVLLRSLYVLIQCYQTGVFYYRTDRLIRHFLQLLMGEKGQPTLQNWKYLCLLVNDLKDSLREQENNITKLITNFPALGKDSEFVNSNDNAAFFTDDSTVYLFTNHLFIPLVSV